MSTYAGQQQAAGRVDPPLGRDAVAVGRGGPDGGDRLAVDDDVDRRPVRHGRGHHRVHRHGDRMVPVTARARDHRRRARPSRGCMPGPGRRAYRGIVGDAFLDGLSDAVWVERWRTIFTEPRDGARTLVSADGDDVTGFARIGPVRDPDPPGPGWDEVYAIYLDPPSWGRRLRLGAAGRAPGRRSLTGVPGVSLWVLRDNALARAFYERHGFEVDGSSQEITIEGQALPEVRYRRCRSQGGQWAGEPLPGRGCRAAHPEARRGRPHHHPAHPGATAGCGRSARACGGPGRSSGPGWSRSRTSTCRSTPGGRWTWCSRPRPWRRTATGWPATTPATPPAPRCSRPPSG